MRTLGNEDAVRVVRVDVRAMFGDRLCMYYMYMGGDRRELPGVGREFHAPFPRHARVRGNGHTARAPCPAVGTPATNILHPLTCVNA
jgi:hypothetical protein